MKALFFSAPILLLILTGCSYNHKITKTYETENHKDSDFEISENRAWCHVVPTKDKKAKKFRRGAPFYFTFNIRVAPEHTEPVVITTLTLTAPNGDEIDLRPEEAPLTLILSRKQKGQPPNTRHVNFGDRRVIYWRSANLPFDFDPKNPVKATIEAKIGDEVTKKTIIYQPVIKKQHKTPLNIFDAV